MFDILLWDFVDFVMARKAVMWERGFGTSKVICMHFSCSGLTLCVILISLALANECLYKTRFMACDYISCNKQHGYQEFLTSSQESKIGRAFGVGGTAYSRFPVSHVNTSQSQVSLSSYMPKRVDRWSVRQHEQQFRRFDWLALPVSESLHPPWLVAVIW